jgi:hypothetical protein
MQIQDLDLSGGGLHIDSRDFPSVINALSKLLAAIMGIGLLVFGIVLATVMRAATNNLQIAVLALGIVLALTGAILVIALLIPNTAVTKAVLSGIAQIVGRVLVPFVTNKDTGKPVDQAKHDRAKRRAGNSPLRPPT